MPDTGFPEPLLDLRPEPPRPRRLSSPLLRRILLVNALPLALLVAALLYLDQYQNGLLEAEVGALREQARIYAGALGQSAVADGDTDSPKLVPEIARPLLRRLTDPTPTAQAKLYAPDGSVIADTASHDPGMPGRGLPPVADRNDALSRLGVAVGRVLAFLPHAVGPALRVDETPGAGGPDWQPVGEELRLSLNEDGRDTPAYIRRTPEDRLLVTVAVPVERSHHTVGIVLVTRDAREVDNALLQIRLSILGVFALALGLTVLLSWYLSLTIARPILRLAEAAGTMREGQGRSGAVPSGLLARRDEIGALSHALHDGALALWGRMDAIERFAADVAHEIKNPLSSIRSAVETLRRLEPDNQAARARLQQIIADDVNRLNRLISDISDASRVDAELSRTPPEPVDLAPLLHTLAEIAGATSAEGDAAVMAEAPETGLVVAGNADRLVQVLRNLIANAQSFSPPHGTIRLGGRADGPDIAVTVDDEGPGIPQAKLRDVFDRFYSERPKAENFGQHSGLGLSISRQIVEALRGTIAAENRHGVDGRVIGARFIIRLPRLEHDLGDHARPPRRSGRPDG